MYHDIRRAVVDAQLDDPHAPWQHILFQVLEDGNRFGWQDGETIHMGVLIRVFADLYGVSEDMVKAEVRTTTDNWPNQRGLPWYS